MPLSMLFHSMNSLSIEERVKLGHNASSSRVYDVLLDSPTVPLKSKRQFVMEFIGHYHTLVDDRIGSRVGDRCWSFADTYLKVPPSPLLKEYKTALVTTHAVHENKGFPKEHGRAGINNPTEPKIQGSVLLQSVLRLSDPYNHIVIARCVMRNLINAVIDAFPQYELFVNRRTSETRS